MSPKKSGQAVKFPNLLILRQRGRPNRLFVWDPESIKRRRRFYGVEGDPEARARYDADKAAWEASPPKIVKKPATPSKRVKSRSRGVLVAELIDAFLTDADQKYRKHGRPTGTADNYRKTLRPIRELYGRFRTADFTLDVLEEYQRDLDRSRRLCRRQVNKAIGAICYVFAWGARHRIDGERFVPADIAAELRLIAPLRAGYAESIDHPRKRSVAPGDVEAALKWLTPTVADMVRIQVLTGARPQEVRLMRAGDFETIDDGLWHYRPSEFKTEHVAGEKIISVGPQAIAILSKRLNGLADGEYVFSPGKSVEEKNARRARTGVKKTPSRAARDAERAANPQRHFNDCYRRDTYALAIKRACVKAGVPVFTPYQLRKLRGTEIDRAFGAEAASAVLGHADVATTLRHYIDPRRDQADDIARKYG